MIRSLRIREKNTIKSLIRLQHNDTKIEQVYVGNRVEKHDLFIWVTGSKTIDQVYVQNQIENHIARGAIYIADARTRKTKYS